jgi:hypothetical protein
MSKYATFLDDITRDSDSSIKNIQTEKRENVRENSLEKMMNSNPGNTFQFSQSSYTPNQSKLSGQYYSLGTNNVLNKQPILQDNPTMSSNKRIDSTSYVRSYDKDYTHKGNGNPIPSLSSPQSSLSSKNVGRDIRKVLTNYFENPLLRKLKFENGMYTYGVRLGQPVLLGYRYLFVLFPESYVNKNNHLRDEIMMSMIPFEFLQTREIKEFYNLPVTNYKQEVKSEYMIPIHVKQENNQMSIYETELKDFEVTLLQDKYKKPYQPNGNLLKALETYNTIVRVL